MPNLHDDLRSTGEAVRADADEIERLEAEKAALDPADPRVNAISGRIEVLSRRLRDKAASERALSDEIEESTTREA
jgi:hypothetical protein